MNWGGSSGKKQGREQDEQEEGQQEEEGRVDGQRGDRARRGRRLSEASWRRGANLVPPSALPWDANWSPGATITPRASPQAAASPKLRNPHARGIRGWGGDWVSQSVSQSVQVGKPQPDRTQPRRIGTAGQSPVHPLFPIRSSNAWCISPRRPSRPNVLWASD